MFNSKTTRLVVTALGVIAVIMVVYSYRTRISEITHEGPVTSQESSGGLTELEIHDLQKPGEAVTNKPVSLLSEDAKDRKVVLERQGFSARTGIESQDIIEDLYAEGFDKTAMELKGRLTSLCFPGSLGADLDSLGWLGEKIQRYCESVFISDDEYADTMAEFRSTVEREIAELKFQFHGLTSSERNELIEEKIANAFSWRELELLKLIIRAPPPLGESTNWVHDLGQSDVFTGDKGRDVQVAALQLYQCELLGSYCDSGSMATISACYFSPVCQPGWTMRDFYENTLSPLEFEQVDIVLEYFRSLGWGG